MKRAPHFGIIFFTLLIGIGAISACKPSPSPGSNANQPLRERVPGQRGGAIAYRLTSPPKTFNPLMAADEPSLIVSFFLLSSRLIHFDHDTQTYVPGLAESWTRSSDARTVAVKLRDGLQFSDGHALTADDVAFTLRALYDERTGAPLFRDSMKIGGKEIAVTVVDNRTLRFTFPDIVAAPESYLTNLFVLPRHILEDDLKQGKLGAAWGVTADPQRIVTSGPFTIAASTPGERVTLARNPHYWKKDEQGVALPYLDTLTLEVVSDANNAMARLQQNAIDLIDRVRASDYANLRTSSSAVRGFDAGPGLITDHFWFNLNDGQRNGQPIVNPAKRAWFSSVRFRRAVSYAIDREAIAMATLQGLATPLYGIISPSNRIWAATDLSRTEYSLDKARALLQEAGFTTRGNSDAPELVDAEGNRVAWTLLVPIESEPRKLMAAVIQADLNKLGMAVQVAPLEFQALTDRWARSFDYDAVLTGISLTDIEPSSYDNLLLSRADMHQWSPKEPRPATDWEARLDELVTAQSHETDPQRRLALVHEMQVIMAEQLPVIPIVVRHVLTAASVRIGNCRPSNIIPFSLWNADELFVKP
jgi:peptide/nickel transport system substrate-binding protein